MNRVRVIVTKKDGMVKSDFTLDYDNREQQQRLGRGCMDALKNGEAVITIPYNHPHYREESGINFIY